MRYNREVLILFKWWALRIYWGISSSRVKIWHNLMSHNLKFRQLRLNSITPWRPSLNVITTVTPQAKQEMPLNWVTFHPLVSFKLSMLQVWSIATQPISCFQTPHLRATNNLLWVVDRKNMLILRVILRLPSGSSSNRINLEYCLIEMII